MTRNLRNHISILLWMMNYRVISFMDLVIVIAVEWAVKFWFMKRCRALTGEQLMIGTALH